MRLLGFVVVALATASQVALSQAREEGGRRFPHMGFELVYGACCEPLRIDQHQEAPDSATTRMGGIVLRRPVNRWFAWRLEGLRTERRGTVHVPRHGNCYFFCVGPYDRVVHDVGSVGAVGGDLKLSRGRVSSSLTAAFGGISHRTGRRTIMPDGEVREADPVKGTGEIWSFGARVGYRMVFAGAHYLVPAHPIGALKKSIGILTVGTQW